MEGGTSNVTGVARVVSYGKMIPLAWWIPQKERALLAVVSTCFWGFTILQAIEKDPSGASVLSFYGLGLLYTVCVMANVGGGARTSLAKYSEDGSSAEQARALVQLFGIMSSMLVCNALVFIVYLEKGAALTRWDIDCTIIAAIVLVMLFDYFGRGTLQHPFARSYMAMACKALPQFFLALLFLSQPIAAEAFTLWAVGCLAVLAGLRFWPSLLTFKRDRKNKHMQGLFLGEAANMASIVFMCLTWSLATW